MAKGLITDRAFVPVQCSMQQRRSMRSSCARRSPAVSSWMQRPSFTATRSGKYIFWQEDITELVALLEELRLTQEELHDIGDIIQAETARRHNG